MKQRSLNYIAQFILTVSAGFCLLTRELWLIIPMLAAVLYLKANKLENQKDREELEEFSNKVFAGSILLPIGVIFLVLVSLVAYVIIRKTL